MNPLQGRVPAPAPLLALVACATLFNVGNATPAQSQESRTEVGELAQLTDLELLRDAFDGDRGHVRLVALLSPTCAYCVKGYRYMRRLLDEIPDERLRMYVVWEPMLSADTERIAEKQAGRAADSRLVFQAWDESRLTGRAWRDLMGYSSDAWDVYYLYGPEHTWASGIVEPDYWQHQFEGPAELRLDYQELKREILALLEEGS